MVVGVARCRIKSVAFPACENLPLPQSPIDTDYEIDLDNGVGDRQSPNLFPGVWRSTAVKTTLTLLTALRLAVLAALAFAMSASAAEPSRLEVKPLNSAPGWLLDGKPHVPIQAQAGRCGYCEVKDGRLSLGHGATVQAAAPNGLGDSFSVACTLTLEKPRIGDAGTYFTAVGVDASAPRRTIRSSSAGSGRSAV